MVRVCKLATYKNKMTWYTLQFSLLPLYNKGTPYGEIPWGLLSVFTFSQTQGQVLQKISVKLKFVAKLKALLFALINIVLTTVCISQISTYSRCRVRFYQDQ